MKLVENVHELWKVGSRVIFRVGRDVLGVLTGLRPPGNKDVWWWNYHMKEVINAKKETTTTWEAPERQQYGDSYRHANDAAKKEVAKAKTRSLSEAYEELETPCGDRHIFGVAKTLDKATRDSIQIKQTKDEEGAVSRDE